MSSVKPVIQNKVQACPHGLPVGACPVCGGMGSGSKSVSKSNKYSHPGQTMSLDEMYAIWNRIKAAQARKEEENIQLRERAEMLAKTRHVLVKVVKEISSVLNKIENMLPKPVAEVFHKITDVILKPLRNIIEQFPQAVKNFNEFIQNIKLQLFIAAEKLSSVFGEMKNFVRKNLSETFKKFTKKVHKILALFGLETNEDYEEDKEAIAEISVFKAKDVKDLKKILFRLITKKNKDEDDDKPRH